MDASAFIRDVADRLRRDESRAHEIVYLVFQEVRAHVTTARASKLGTYLPPAVRALWMETEPPLQEPPYQLELLGDVMQRGGLSDTDEAERAVVTVFTALQEVLGYVSGAARTTRRIFEQLPPHLEIFWLAAARARASTAKKEITHDGRRRRPRPP